MNFISSFIGSLLVGMAMGGVASFINARAAKKCIENPSQEVLSKFKRTNTFVGSATLILAFVVGKLLPMHTEAVVIGAVVILPLLNIFYLYKVLSINPHALDQDKTEE